MKIKTLQVGELGTNCYLVSDDSGITAIIDPGDDFETICDALEGLTPATILLTHGHFDHTGAVNALKIKYDCEVVISALDEEMLDDDTKNAAFLINMATTPIKAERLVNDGDIVEVGDLKFEVIATAGHTKGSVTYKIEDKLFTGDTLFKGTVGRCDLYGGNPVTLIRSLQKLAKLEGDYEVFAGHDRKTTLEYERQTNHYLRTKK